MKNVINRKSEIVNVVRQYFGPPHRVQYYYHYTTMTALVNGIIPENPVENEEICMRATHCDYMNDTKEILHGVDFLAEYYYNQQKQIHSNINKRKYISMFKKDRALQWKRYIISFSHIKDSLPMWNMYADKGAGIRIAFHAFNSLSDTDLVLNCCYNEEDLIHKLNSYSTDSENFSFVMRLTQVYIPLMFKDKSYEYEKEIRLIGTFRGREIKYRVRDGVIIPYVEVKFPSSQISSIMIGPAANQEMTEKSLRKFLDKRGFEHVKIEHSIIPYRG